MRKTNRKQRTRRNRKIRTRKIYEPRKIYKNHRESIVINNNEITGNIVPGLRNFLQN